MRFYIDCQTRLKCDIEMLKKMLLLFFWQCKLEKSSKFFRNCEKIFINIVESKKLASFKIDILKSEKSYVTFVLKFCVDILRFRLIIVDFAKHEVRSFKNLICLSLTRVLTEKMLVFNWKNANLKYLFFDLLETFNHINWKSVRFRLKKCSFEIIVFQLVWNSQIF